MRIVLGGELPGSIPEIFIVYTASLSTFSTTPYLDLGYTKLDSWIVGAGGNGGNGGTGWSDTYDRGGGGGGGGGAGALVRHTGLLLASLTPQLNVEVAASAGFLSAFNGAYAYAGGRGGHGGSPTTTEGGHGGGGGGGGGGTSNGNNGSTGASGGVGGATGGAGGTGGGGRGAQGSTNYGQVVPYNANNGSTSGLAYGGGGGGGGMMGLAPSPVSVREGGLPGRGLGGRPGDRRFYTGNESYGYGGAGAGGAGGHDLTALTGQPNLDGAGGSPDGIDTANPARRPGAGGQGASGQPGSVTTGSSGAPGVVVLRLYR